jgi:RNA polymerase sigma-70 factor (ECF subfamily)
MIAMTTPPDSLADSKGLRAAYDECAPRIRRYLTHVLRDEHAAEDVLQQVMLEGWQRSASYDPARGSRMTWLMTIARSRAIDYLRRQVPEPHDPQTTTAMIDRVAAEEVAADRLAGQAALAQLLRMRFHLDMTQSEIAEATGIPLGTVKMRMVAALRRLREMLDAEGEGAT